LEITLRFGQTTAPVMIPSASGAPTLTRKPLVRASEAVHIDTNYSNRTGYLASFIDGFQVPMPALSPALSQNLAPLNHDQPFWNKGELKYEHFSVLLNKNRRMAIFTATNIDSAAYKNVDRDTGFVSEPEGETWYHDQRVNSDFYLDQPFYSEWSTYFDRG